MVDFLIKALLRGVIVAFLIVQIPFAGLSYAGMLALPLSDILDSDADSIDDGDGDEGESELASWSVVRHAPPVTLTQLWFYALKRPPVLKQNAHAVYSPTGPPHSFSL